MTPKPNTKCEICNADFYVSPGHKAVGWGRFCSFACRGVAVSGSGNARWKAQGDTTCQQCKKEFHRRPSHHGMQIFCSDECKNLAYPKDVERVCRTCKKDFTTKAWKVKQGVAVYCSKKCQTASLKTAEMIVMNCLCCKKDFEVKRSSIFRIATGERRPEGTGNFCSMKCKTKFSSSTQITPAGADRNAGSKRARSGKRADIGIYVRSSWEANYARYLNVLIEHGEIVSWEYEPDTFEFEGLRGNTSFYTPDFKVFKPDGEFEYHEIKGWMDPKSATKLSRMKKYFPDVPLLLVDKVAYKKLAAKVSWMVPGWE